MIVLPWELRQVMCAALGLVSPSVSRSASLWRLRVGVDVVARRPPARLYASERPPVPLAADTANRWNTPQHYGEGRTVDETLFDDADSYRAELEPAPGSALDVVGRPADVLTGAAVQVPSRTSTIALPGFDEPITKRILHLLEHDGAAAETLFAEAVAHGLRVRPDEGFARFCFNKLTDSFDLPGYLDWLPLVPESEWKTVLTAHATIILQRWANDPPTLNRFVEAVAALTGRSSRALVSVVGHLAANQPDASIISLYHRLGALYRRHDLSVPPRVAREIISQAVFSRRFHAALTVYKEEAALRLQPSTYRRLVEQILVQVDDETLPAPVRARSAEQLAELTTAWTFTWPLSFAFWKSGDAPRLDFPSATWTAESVRERAQLEDEVQAALAHLVTLFNSPDQTAQAKPLKVGEQVRQALELGYTEADLRNTIVPRHPSRIALRLFGYSLIKAQAEKHPVNALSAFCRYFLPVGVSQELVNSAMQRASGPLSPISTSSTEQLSPDVRVLTETYRAILRLTPSRQTDDIYQSFLRENYDADGNVLPLNRQAPTHHLFECFIDRLLHLSHVSKAIVVCKDATRLLGSGPSERCWTMLATWCATKSRWRRTVHGWNATERANLALGVVWNMHWGIQPTLDAFASSKTPSPQSGRRRALAGGPPLRWAWLPSMLDNVGGIDDVAWPLARPSTYFAIAAAFAQAGNSEAAKRIQRWAFMATKNWATS